LYDPVESRSEPCKLLQKSSTGSARVLLLSCMSPRMTTESWGASSSSGSECSRPWRKAGLLNRRSRHLLIAPLAQSV
jgi:hypothetical protein